MPLYGPLSPAESAALSKLSPCLLEPAYRTPLSPAESAALSKPQFTGKAVDFERFCEAHPYRVVGPENMPERRFATLVCAARTAASAGPPFHVECGEFRASYAECRRLANNADFDRQVQEAREETKYWEKIEEPK